MSESYESFAANAFGPVLADVARTEYGGRLTPKLLRRATQGWNLTYAAMAAVVREAKAILAEEQGKT